MGERADKTTAAPSQAPTSTPKPKTSTHAAPEPDEVYRLAGLAPHRIADLPATIDLGQQPANQTVYLDVAHLKIRDGFSGTGDVTAEAFHDDAIGGPKPSLDFAPSALQLGTGPGDDTLRVKFRATRPGLHDARLSVRIDWSDGLRTHLTTKLVARVPRGVAKPTPVPTATGAPAHESNHAAEAAPRHESEHNRDHTRATTIAHKWRLALPDKIAFEDVALGRVTTMQTHVFHLDHPNSQGPRVTARVLGEDGITLVRAPLFLPGAAQTPTDADAFKLSYRRAQPGRPKGALEIEILDMPQETFRVPFSVGFPEIEQRAREREGEERADKERQARDGLEMQARADEYYERNPREKFDSVIGLVGNALSELSHAHVNGVGNAEVEASQFVRRIPPNKPSLLESLAGVALEIGFAAVAGGIAKRMEPALKAAFAGDQGLYIVGFITDGFKQSIKSAGAAVSGSVLGGTSKSKRSPQLPGQPPDSPNPLIAFFGQQRDRIGASDTDRKDRVLTRFRGALLASFDPGKSKQEATTAIQVMQSLRDSIKHQTLEARKEQAQASAQAWVRYVAETSSENSVAAPHARFDGLVDLTARAMSSYDGRISVRGARILGVSQSIAKRLLNGPLEKQHVPIRLVIEVAGTRDEETVTILRDADGGITVNDSLPSDRSWLGRVSRKLNPTHEDELVVARALLTREILGRSLEDLSGDRGLETDSER